MHNITPIGALVKCKSGALDSALGPRPKVTSTIKKIRSHQALNFFSTRDGTTWREKIIEIIATMWVKTEY